MENESLQLLKDFIVKCDNVIEAKWSDITLQKEDMQRWIIDTAVPKDVRLVEKEKEAEERYQHLKLETATLVVTQANNFACSCTRS